MDRVHGFGPWGWGFESLRAHQLVSCSALRERAFRLTHSGLRTKPRFPHGCVLVASLLRATSVWVRFRARARNPALRANPTIETQRVTFDPHVSAIEFPGGSRGIRTPDHILKRDLLYQLSYAPTSILREHRTKLFCNTQGLTPSTQVARVPENAHKNIKGFYDCRNRTFIVRGARQPAHAHVQSLASSTEH